MKRLMLDYYRRKWWILAIGTVAELVLGWCSGLATDSGHSPMASLQVQIGLFMGIFLLSFDLQRGLARATTILPLTLKQIARAWWLATVGIPTLACSALLFFGAAAFCVKYPNAHYDWSKPAMCGVFLFLWMGAAFTILMNSTGGFFNTGWRRFLTILSGALWGAMIGGGFFFLQNLEVLSAKVISFYVIASVLTLIGWFGAEYFMRGRVNFKLATYAGNVSRGAVPTHRPGGYGGIPLLISRTLVQSFLIGLAMLLFLPIIMLLQGQLKSWQQGVESLTSAGIFPFWFVIFFALIPAFMQLRFLRSLPISTNQLAFILVALIALPLLALGIFASGMAALFVGSAKAITVAKSYLLTLAPATLSVTFVCLQGMGMLAYLLMILTMVSAQFVPIGFQYIHQGELSLGETGFIALVFIFISFTLTRLALARSSRAYRLQVNPLANGWGWGMSR